MFILNVMIIFCIAMPLTVITMEIFPKYFNFLNWNLFSAIYFFILYYVFIV